MAAPSRRRAPAPHCIRAVALLTAVALAALTGCAADPLVEQYGDGTDPGYISGDGAYLEVPVAQRGEPIEFAGTDEHGDPVSSADYAGQVAVVNFWYAGCPPCRVEAPDLAAVARDYGDVGFLGVNTQDGAHTALLFAQEYDIPYPSVLDATTASVQLAFAGTVAPNAVPSTIILDREGRVAGRISGLIAERSILESMLDRVLDES